MGDVLCALHRFVPFAGKEVAAKRGAKLRKTTKNEMKQIVFKAKRGPRKAANGQLRETLAIDDQTKATHNRVQSKDKERKESKR